VVVVELDPLWTPPKRSPSTGASLPDELLSGSSSATNQRDLSGVRRKRGIPELGSATFRAGVIERSRTLQLVVFRLIGGVLEETRNTLVDAQSRFSYRSYIMTFLRLSSGETSLEFWLAHVTPTRG